jgi:hypothetical protein
MPVCLDCGEPLKGRSDKKFCSDLCRNNFHNRMSRSNEKFIRNVQNILRRNRRILGELNTGGSVKVHRDELIARGFNFTFHTHSYTTRKGMTYSFCFDQGYIDLGNEYFRLVFEDDSFGFEPFQ